MRVVALRGKLRHSSQPYGVQQLGKLRNARKCDGRILSAQVYAWAFAKSKYLGE